MALDGLFAHLSPEDRDAALTILRVQLARRRRQGPRIVREAKRCPRCRTTRPTVDFGANRARPDGLQVYCKACR